MAQSLECLDRHGLTVEMLRHAIRDTVFRTTGGEAGLLNLGQPVATEFARAAA